MKVQARVWSVCVGESRQGCGLRGESLGKGVGREGSCRPEPHTPEFPHKYSGDSHRGYRVAGLRPPSELGPTWPFSPFVLSTIGLGSGSPLLKDLVTGPPQLSSSGGQAGPQWLLLGSMNPWQRCLAQSLPEVADRGRHRCVSSGCPCEQEQHRHTCHCSRILLPTGRLA